MIRFRFSQLLTIATLGASLLTSPPAAKAENPLERLHRHIMSKLGGDRERDSDCKDKGKKKKHKDDDRRYDHNRDEYNRGGYYSAPSYAQSYARPQPSYDAPYAGRRDDFYAQPEPRGYHQTLPLEAEVQIALQREGYYRGRIDGDLGGQTRAAIRDYQQDRGLYPTGRIDRELLRALQR